MNVPVAPPRRSLLGRGIAVLLGLLLVLVVFLMWWWDKEPPRLDVMRAAEKHANAHGHRMVTGVATTATLIEVVDTLLHKRGGYLSNDIMPPGVFMDNMPNWEFGVLVQVRDLAKAMRNEFSRSQTQSTEDKDLQLADPLFSFSNDRWILPSAESQYRKGNARIEDYLVRLGDTDDFNAQFFARADNLVDWLAIVEKRLGDLSQRLSASVGQLRVDTDLGGDAQATQSTPAPALREVRTPWLQIDDVFYEARGATWALWHFLKAIEHDFEPVLRDKNALVSLRQIIRELEESQSPIWSPMVLNGSQFGFFANHSLVMANYVSRANAAIIDLRKLLDRG